MTNTAQPVPVTIRPVRPADFPQVAEIAYVAFREIAAQHNFPADFPSAAVAGEVLTPRWHDGGFYKRVAEAEGEILGCVFMDERGPVSRIGPITVSPAAQNRGVGRILMQAMIDRAYQQRAGGVRLVQVAYHNRSLSLYLKLGFNPVEALSNLQGPTIGRELPGYSVRAASLDDLPAMNDLCQRAHGLVRTAEVRAAILASTARIVEHAGRITAYTSQLGFDGHSVGETNDDLKALIGAAASFQGPGFLLPTLNAELLRWSLEHGLRIIQPLTAMAMGDYQQPQLPYLPSINA